MMFHFSRHIKRLLIGLLVVKICVTIAVWIDSVELIDVFFTHTATVAQAQEQESLPDNKADNGVSEGSREPTQNLHLVLQSLEAKRLEIQKQEEVLFAKRQQLESIKQEIEARVEELSRMQIKLEETLAQKEAQDAAEKQKNLDAERAKIRQLVKVYANMKPKNAGPIVDKLNLDVAYKIFMHMKGEQAGKILSYVNRDRAAKISERLAAHHSK